QVTLKESGPTLVKPTQTLTLTCTFSGFSLTTTGEGVGWIRQPPGKALEFLAFIYWNDAKRYNPSLQSRLTITKDASKKQVVLTLTNLDPVDTATYYCARTSGWDIEFEYWGQGTLVTVSSGSASAPTLFPLVSCENSSPSSTVAVGCLAQDFLPDSITFSWKYKNNSDISSTRGFPSVLRGGKYAATSQVLLPSKDVMQGTDEHVVCKVQHPNGNKEKDVPLPVVI
uniref:Yvo Fab, Heavy Chain n=1 Tax=Homo sapiens TaxID=9606 RepID=UPI0012FE7E6E|nr:Chain H, IgM Fab, heavy chain [Homo sapiens]8ADY_Q Chain Q, IgM Fab, heavy chain [Homo sapiens]8ADZ_H Chain H, IgM Fab, heavy chain [Homo sapiens]8ADZ_U Chain U, IgM Fab, heavy chain [Homo sapiens]8AE0_H Chain H, IgM Fab, heavy chain [Homo sapiens]8AE0_Q Chain Q, IgM Fab, heavy chain [Homo sapiens]8AE2_H Chain H, IgM Fab, heavy chain [Homo sapiens]8AE2_Q Chain Q, IgM Fab, heavy chain [Homo sapiens]8AE3_H Chain H, IgM Fab, heavy chain [Homo sapiens]8AE3_Q Chain Q, IgM Fab, heavy chain [H